MSYRAALEYLYTLAPRGIELGLGRMETVLAERGHPERVCPAIVVAGTNGKGSVAALIASLLASAGLRVGLFTSPHLHRLVERFRIGGRPVAERSLARKVTELRPYLARPSTPPLTFFELCTLIAFELFREARCDFSVLEVGLGGRLDATNVVTPRVSVITSIGLDHTDRLGPTLAHIAREKAGILRPGVPAVVGVRSAEALTVILGRARRVGAPLSVIDRDFGVERVEARGCARERNEVEARGCARERKEASARVSVWIGARRFQKLPLPFAGTFQADNLACAVAALSCLGEEFVQDAALVRRGLSRARWPGRLELIEGAPSVLCDAAHNPPACAALAEHLERSCAQFTRRVLLFGALRDKDHAGMLALLRPHVDAVVFTTVATPRAEVAELLAARYGGDAFADPGRALARSRKLAGRRGLVIACGSIFVMADVRARLLGLRADPPIAL